MAIDEKDIGEVAKELKGAFEDFKNQTIKSLKQLKLKKASLKKKPTI